MLIVVDIYSKIETCIAVISLSSAAFIPTSPESRIVATFEWKDAKDLKRKSTYFLSAIKTWPL